MDLTGKTVIPALVDAHSHIGYMKDLTSGPENYTRENILDHLHRFAYFGIAASQAMGSDFGELPFQIRDEVHADAARFLTAGRGLAPLAEIRPDNMRHAAYAVTTEQGARAAVEELARRNVKIIKTWVDDRGGTIQKAHASPLSRDHRRGASTERACRRSRDRSRRRQGPAATAASTSSRIWSATWMTSWLRCSSSIRTPRC